MAKSRTEWKSRMGQTRIGSGRDPGWCRDPPPRFSLARKLAEFPGSHAAGHLDRHGRTARNGAGDPPVPCGVSSRYPFLALKDSALERYPAVRRMACALGMEPGGGLGATRPKSRSRSRIAGSETPRWRTLSCRRRARFSSVRSCFGRHTERKYTTRANTRLSMDPSPARQSHTHDPIRLHGAGSAFWRTSPNPE